MSKVGGISKRDEGRNGEGGKQKGVCAEGESTCYFPCSFPCHSPTSDPGGSPSKDGCCICPDAVGVAPEAHQRPRDPPMAKELSAPLSPHEDGGGACPPAA